MVPFPTCEELDEYLVSDFVRNRYPTLLEDELILGYSTKYNAKRFGRANGTHYI